MSPITPATHDDIPALEQLLNRAYRGEPSRQGWSTEADLIEGSTRTDARTLTDLLSRYNAVFLKYTGPGGLLTGCVFLENRAGRLYLGMLSVDPGQQAQGIGKQLLNAADETARRMNCRSIFMSVVSVRAELIAWYERHGYALNGRRMPFETPPEFGVPRMPLEFVEMEKVL